MRLLFLLLTMMSGVAGAAQVEALVEGGVRFQPPDGFSPMSADQIASKFPAVNPPSAAYANADGTVSVSITYPAARVSPDQLDALKIQLEGFLPTAVPGLEWLTREVIEVGGRRWIHLELTSAAIDTGIHNHMYITSYRGRMLGLNFNATIDAHAEHAQDFAESFLSIDIDE